MASGQGPSNSKKTPLPKIPPELIPLSVSRKYNVGLKDAPAPVPGSKDGNAKNGPAPKPVPELNPGPPPLKPWSSKAHELAVLKFQHEARKPPIYMLDDMKISPSITHTGQVGVPYIYNTTRFLVCSLRDLERVKRLYIEIDEMVKNESLTRLNGTPFPGEFVIGMNNVNGKYLRAVVNNVNIRTGNALIEFVDVGNYATVSFDDLYLTNERIREVPLFALSVNLYGIAPGSGKQLDPDYIEKIQTNGVRVMFEHGEIKWNANVFLDDMNGRCINYMVEDIGADVGPCVELMNFDQLVISDCQEPDQKVNPFKAQHQPSKDFSNVTDPGSSGSPLPQRGSESELQPQEANLTDNFQNLGLVN